VHSILVASDAPSVQREIVAVTDGPDVALQVVSSGPEVLEAVHLETPDLLVIDLQMGNMGAMAVTIELRLQESYGAADHIPVLMLLDRRPDVFLARRSGAEGFLIKPLDPLRLRRAVATLLDGGTYADESYQPVPLMVRVHAGAAAPGAVTAAS
jgi:CheY-like chemotaxis protein